MSALLEEVKRIIDEWDPHHYYPENRYGPESFELVKHVKLSNEPITIELINYFINYLLNHGMYDSNKRFCKSKADTLEISIKLFEVFKKIQSNNMINSRSQQFQCKRIANVIRHVKVIVVTAFFSHPQSSEQKGELVYEGRSIYF